VEVIVGTEVAVRVGGISVGVTVADGMTNVAGAGKAVASGPLEQLSSKSKIQIKRSRHDFMSDLTEQNTLRFQD
jgi:hypothetical protein